MPARSVVISRSNGAYGQHTDKTPQTQLQIANSELSVCNSFSGRTLCIDAVRLGTRQVELAYFKVSPWF